MNLLSNRSQFTSVECDKRGDSAAVNADAVSRDADYWLTVIVRKVRLIILIQIIDIRLGKAR